MNNSVFTFFSIFFLIFFFGCNSSKNIATVQKEPPVVYKPLPSRIVLHYKLDKKTIRDTFNNAISEIFKENFNIPDYDLKMNFYKTKEANVEIEGKSILVNIPVGILVEKNTFFTDFKARGVLELTFITKFDIDSLWNFTSKTELSYYKWLEKPVLNMGAIQIPIEPLSNVIISKSKPFIVESIDESINNNFDIQSTIRESIQIFKDPMQLDPDSGGFLSLTPTKIQLVPLKNSKLYTSGKIVMDLTSQFSTNKPLTTGKALRPPGLEWKEKTEDTTTLRLVTQIKMMDINQWVRKHYDGKTFSAQGKSFTLSGIFINCDYDNIRFVTDIKGDANGTLIITGKPEYDPVSNSFKTNQIDIKFKTKNRIHKAASWIAEGYIKKELMKMMTFPLEAKLDEIQNDINTQLGEINKEFNMDVKANLHSIKAERFYMKPGEIETTILASLYLQAYIKDLKSFGATPQKKK